MKASLEGLKAVLSNWCPIYTCARQETPNDKDAHNARKIRLAVYTCAQLKTNQQPYMGGLKVIGKDR
jgi:hypothetical protein